MKVSGNLFPSSLTTQPINNQENPFDIDLKTESLKLTGQEMAPVTSKSLCTPGCGMTGTGNSFCCTCR